MSEEHRRERLEEAGYTGKRGTIVFCVGLAILGYGMGSFFLFVLLNILIGPEFHEYNLPAGGSLGALIFAVIGYMKIRRANQIALDTVEDDQWRRELGEKRPRRK